MSHKPREFANGELYHIILRRIANEELFLDVDDYYRGVFSIYEFNNRQSVEIKKRRRKILSVKRKFWLEQFQKDQIETNQANQMRQIRQPWRRAALRQKSGGGQPSATSSSRDDKPSISRSSRIIIPDERDRFVDVLLFVLMPNHIHLLVRQLKDGGISSYMQKMGSGLSSYFRAKYNPKLTGHFFQDRFKSVHIKTDRQLIVIFSYIHTNPLSLIEPGWKEKGIKNPKKAFYFLENDYRWSSYFDYLGRKNFPSVTERNFILETIGGKEEARKIVDDWILEKAKTKKEMENFSDIFLE